MDLVQKDLLGANKVLRFAKEASQQHLFRIKSHGNLADLCLGAYTDASWAVRPDGSSQGALTICTGVQKSWLVFAGQVCQPRLKLQQ